MAVGEKAPAELTADQQNEGYSVEPSGDYVLVWHRNNQIALLQASPDINEKVQEVVERRRRDLKEIEEKTGWKPDK
ncbi:MAG: hypothetical protein HYX92_01645 [Chloroflexi bacterium]|nr:hypothetical protein [Chloroflexota bacterium]